jgi:hypothetical protein
LELLRVFKGAQAAVLPATVLAAAASLFLGPEVFAAVSLIGATGMALGKWFSDRKNEQMRHQIDAAEATHTVSSTDAANFRSKLDRVKLSEPVL